MSDFIECPTCRRKLRMPAGLEGSLGKCPVCGATFTVSAAPPAESAAPVASAEPLLPLADEQCRSCGAPVPPGVERCPACVAAALDDTVDAPAAPAVYAPSAPVVEFEPHRGALVLTLGILSLVLLVTVVLSPVGLALGLYAWVMGNNDLNQMRQRLMDRRGEDITQAGMVCGIIGTVVNSIMSLCCLSFLGLLTGGR